MPRWSRRLPKPVIPADGGPLVTLLDVARYMEGMGERRLGGQRWRHLVELLLDAAERGGDLDAVREQLKLALLYDAKLDMERTEI